MNTIAYILAEFPSQTETFILKEALYVNESIPLYIIALKKGKTPIDNDVQMAFESRIIYIPPWWSWKVLPIGSVFSYTVAEQSRSMTHNPLKTLVMAGLNRHPLSYLQIFRQLKVWLIASFVSKMIKKLKIQHMHAHFANYPTDVAMLVSHLSGIPFSFSAHAHDIYVNPTNLPSKIHKATFVTTCTDYNKKHLAAIVPPVDQVKIHLVYHGVDTVKWKYHKKEFVRGTYRILTIGRLIEKKGLIYLLEALYLLLKKGISIHLYIVGEGTEAHRLKQFCRKFQLEQNVVFTGWQTPQQIKRLFSQSDIFVLPSIVTPSGDRDGIPNVILEAMASGVPVISTSVSGIPEVIQNEFNGLLVAEKNSEQLSYTILTLIKNIQLRNTLISNALKTIQEKFETNQCNQTLVTLFDHVFSGMSSSINPFSIG